MKFLEVVLIYIDNIIVLDNTFEIEETIDIMHKTFALKDLSHL